MLQSGLGIIAKNHVPTTWSRGTFTPAVEPFALLAAQATRISTKRGQELFAEGTDADFCYRLISGHVSLVKLMADGRRQVCEFLGADDLLGFEVDDEYYFTAETVSDCVFMRYPRRAVDALLAEDKLFARHVRKITARGLQGAYHRMVLLCNKSAQERMAWFLLDVADRANRDDDLILLPMTRTDIANYLGMAIETVSRVLGQFKQNGTIVQKSLHRIHLCDRDALETVRGEI